MPLKFSFETTPKKPARANPVRRSSGVPIVPLRRNFDGAKGGLLYGAWTSASVDINQLLRSQLPTLRARSRDLSRNNEYAKGFLRVMTRNVIGAEGIQVQVRSKNPDGSFDMAANETIENAWRDFSRPGAFTLDGQLARVEAERLFIRLMARDGEVFVRRLRGPSFMPQRYGIQFIPPESVDESYCSELPGGRFVFMGIEFNEWRRPIAYHILTRNPGGDATPVRAGAFRERIPADEIIHKFIADDVNQVRGVPWMAAGMARLKMLGGYMESEAISARVGAGKMGFYKQSEFADNEVSADWKTDAGELVQDSEPGTWRFLPEGVEVQEYDPTHPNDAFGDFVKAMLRGFAAGVGISYNTLANDLEGVNYSSLRQGSLDDQDEWRTLQVLAVQHFDQVIFADWLEWQLILGRLGSLPAIKFDKFNAPIWRPRGWDWVDPLKEAKAHREELAMGTTSRTAICAKRGRSFDDVCQEIQAEKDIAASYGLTLAEVDAAVPALPAPKDETDDDEKE